jgi:hypothetical protein
MDMLISQCLHVSKHHCYIPEIDTNLLSRKMKNITMVFNVELLLLHGIVLVVRAPVTRWQGWVVKQQKFFVSQFWRLEVQNRDINIVGFF